MTGILVVAVVVVLALGLGSYRRWNDGRVRAADESPSTPRLTAVEIGEPLGSEATLVQFSSAFCAPCRATRSLLSHVADPLEGVEHVEIDVTQSLDVARQWHVARTPTTLLVDADGIERFRCVGVPKRHQIEAALASLRTGSDPAAGTGTAATGTAATDDSGAGEFQEA